jgi:hypothetical protein
MGYVANSEGISKPQYYKKKKKKEEEEEEEGISGC